MIFSEIQGKSKFHGEGEAILIFSGGFASGGDSEISGRYKYATPGDAMTPLSHCDFTLNHKRAVPCHKMYNQAPNDIAVNKSIF